MHEKHLCKNIGANSCSKNATWQIGTDAYVATYACSSHLSGVLGHFLSSHKIESTTVWRVP